MSRLYVLVALLMVPLVTISGCKKRPLHRLPRESAERGWQKARPNREKKKITVFMSRGGGGHIAVANALKAYLEPQYEVSVVNIFDDVLYSLDPIRSVTFNRYTGEDLYNFFLKHQLTWIVNNIFCKYGAWQALSQRRDVERLLTRFLRHDMPDLIISDMPLVNASLLAVSKKMQIPFLVLTNDLDTSNYINGFAGSYGNDFCYTLPYDDQEMFSKIKEAKIPRDQIAITGFPLRPDFFMPKDKQAIKDEFNLPHDKPVVMLLMGGAGSDASYHYAKQIAKMDTRLHLLVCLGRNEQLVKKISKLKTTDGVSISTVGYTPRISDFMAVADVLITKPGPGSISEAIYMNLPMLLDLTSRPIRWERMNISFVEKWQFGDVVRTYKDLPAQLSRYLNDKAYYAQIKSNLEQFPKVRCQERINQLVAHLLALNKLQNSGTLHATMKQLPGTISALPI